MPTMRYWAGAKAAAGVETETVDATTVGSAIDSVSAARPALATVLPHCALLVDGRRVQPTDTVTADEVIEVLPPFAGG